MTERACTAFRRALASALAAGVHDDAPGAPLQGKPSRTPGEERAREVELGWHEHLLACPSCRAFLAAEQALDGLLATLPRPRLPGDLARRVLVRLDGVRAQERGERRLDDLLDFLPSPAPPGDLAARTLRRLASERGAPRLRVLRAVLPRIGWRIAAGVLFAAALSWLLLGRRDEPRDETPVARQVEDELLETLDVLENWELLMSDDLDLMLAELDAVDWTLLEYGSDEADADGDEEERGG